MLLSGEGFRVVAESEVLNAARLQQIGDALQAGSPTVDELLLVEAGSLLHGEQVTAPERVTLLSAMAVEFCTRRTLVKVAKETKQDALLDLLLENPRDWSMSAHGLFLKALPALLGEQLGPQHSALAKDVQKLFTDRNRVVHRGHSISKAKAKVHFENARLAVIFLLATGATPRQQ
jgi:hypothetical protein